MRVLRRRDRKLAVAGAIGLVVAAALFLVTRSLWISIPMALVAVVCALGVLARAVARRRMRSRVIEPNELAGERTYSLRPGAEHLVAVVVSILLGGAIMEMTHDQTTASRATLATAMGVFVLWSVADWVRARMRPEVVCVTDTEVHIPDPALPGQRQTIPLAGVRVRLTGTDDAPSLELGSDDGPMFELSDARFEPGALAELVAVIEHRAALLR